MPTPAPLAFEAEFGVCQFFTLLPEFLLAEAAPNNPYVCALHELSPDSEGACGILETHIVVYAVTDAIRVLQLITPVASAKAGLVDRLSKADGVSDMQPWSRCSDRSGRIAHSRCSTES